MKKERKEGIEFQKCKIKIFQISVAKQYEYT
jgi:hypothetical protein